MSGLEEFCCICVRKLPDLVNIKEADVENTKYIHKLAVCVPDKKWNELFNLCQDCVEKLDLAYKFIELCLKSEHLRLEQLKLLLEKKIKEESKQFDSFECYLCKKCFKWKKSLKFHITRVHQNPKSKQEEKDTVEHQMKIEIDVSTEFELGLKKSEPEEKNVDPSLNQNDDISSTDEDKALELIRKKHKQRKNPLSCEYCGKLFFRKQHYSAHIRSKHTFERPYKCDKCDAKYTNSHSLLVHKRNHNNEKPFVCTSCGKSFVCSGDLYHHSKIHSNKREYKCTTCGKGFNTTSILRTHKLCMHTDPKEWKYVCTYCPKRFPLNSSLVVHIKRHAGIKEFTCQVCNKQFCDKSELNKHLRSHTTDRKYKCDVCKKDYKNPYGLRKHQKVIHGIGDMKIQKLEKKFLCSMCPKIFFFNNKLQTHLRTHTGEKPFKCTICNKNFIDKYYRKVHMKNKHDTIWEDSS